MSTKDALKELYTGDPGMDERLEQAFSLGVSHGRELEKRNQITAHLTALAVADYNLEQMMTLFQIPKAQKKGYRSIVTTRLKQKGITLPGK